MKGLSIAVEYERGLHDLDGVVSNKALEFLEHPLNIDENGNHRLFHIEGTSHQNEYNSPPRESVDDLCLDLLEAEDVSRRICEDLGVINIPISETGAGKGIVNPHPHVLGRTIGYNVIFGTGSEERIIKISGAHIHIDQYKPRLADQFNLLTALRPMIAITSTSSISHERLNSENCQRYKLFADPVDGVFAAIPEERSYITSIQELIDRDQRRYRNWKNTYDTECWRFDIPKDYRFSEHFTQENTGYADIRNRPDVGKGTFEFRINDSAPMDIVIGQAALVLGYSNRTINNNIPVKIAEENDFYKFTDEEVVLPNEETLEKYTALAVKYGLEHEEIKQYLNSLENFAREGLEQNEQHYLTPIREMIDTGKNIASQILDYLGHKPIYTEQEAALANKFVWNLQQQAIANLQESVGYRS